MSNWEIQKVKVTGNENVYIIVAHTCQKWTDLRQIKNKMIISPFYTYYQIHLLAETYNFALLVDVCCIPFIHPGLEH